MGKAVVVSRARRLAGAGALVATAGGLAAVAVHDLRWIEWGLLGFAGLVGLAGIGLARQSLVSQILARGTAWVVLAPSAAVAAFTMLGGHAPDLLAFSLMGGSSAALALSQPILHTASARAQFAPSWFRRWLLASATASATAGVVSGVVALDALRWHTIDGIALVALSLSLLASTIGVVRMRAWGLLLGIATSIVSLVAAVAMHDAAGFALALAAIPGLMFALPVVAAKRDRARAERERARAATAYVRVADAISATAPTRMRVASEPDADMLEDGDTAGRGRAALHN